MNAHVHAHHAVSWIQRVRWRLPLSVAGLLVVVVVILSWAAYREVRAASLEAAEARLGEVAQQLASLLSRMVQGQVGVARRAADDPAVRAVLADRSADAVERARAVLEEYVAAETQTHTLTLWDAAGALVVAAGQGVSDVAPRVARRAPSEWMRGDSAAVSGLESASDAVSYEVAVEARGEQGVLGHAVLRRRLTTSPAGIRLLTDLIGMDATFLVGEPGGIWTDLARVVEGPPVAASGEPMNLSYRTSDGTAVLGSGLPIAGTPWLMWVVSPLDLVLERPRTFLSEITLIGGLIVLAGVAGGAVLSHRLTGRLAHLTATAGAIASGDYTRSAPVEGEDELDDVARAFNSMAQRVGHAQRHLEEQVAARTAELEANVAEFRSLATTVSDAIVTADEEGRITYFNPGAERIFGHAAEAMRGLPLTVLMPDRFREAHREGLARYLATGVAKVLGTTVELVGQRDDGSEFPIELSLSSHRRDGHPVFVGSIRDITRRKRDEEALRAYAAELEAANAELDAFSYSVSHDLRAPLRAIYGFSQALIEDCADALSEKGIEHLTRVCAAAERMGILIDDLLALSRATRTEMQREPVDLGALADEIGVDLRATTPERRVELRIEKGLEAMGDRRLLTQVLRNLLENAWKFTATRNPAEIEVGRSEAEGAFFVRDNGAGFDMTYADKLFDPFQRLHSAREFSGTGIGLALVQRIVRRHGGRVWGEGSVDRGATFYFDLPPTRAPRTEE